MVTHTTSLKIAAQMYMKLKKIDNLSNVLLNFLGMTFQDVNQKRSNLFEYSINSLCSYIFFQRQVRYV